MKIDDYKTDRQTLYTHKQRGKKAGKCISVSKAVTKNKIRIKYKNDAINNKH